MTSTRDIRRLDHIGYSSMSVGSNLTTLRSSNADITCNATGFPPPRVTWYRRGALLDVNGEYMFNNETGTLHLISLTMNKTGRYTCVANNIRGSDSVSSTVTVKGKLSRVLLCMCRFCVFIYMLAYVGTSICLLYSCLCLWL